MLFILLVMSFCAFGEFGVKAALRVDFEDVDIVAIDRKYIDPDKTELSVAEDEDTGETSLSSRVVFVKKPPPETAIRLTLTGLSMGKYTVPTGVDMKMTLCEMLAEPILMGPFLAVLGFSQSACPPEPGEYSTQGYKLPTESLPDEFPENKYLVIIGLSLKGKPIITIHIYVNVQVE